jgi:PQQ-dependent dehydrogenase (methanol/ethanol family)
VSSCSRLRGAALCLAVVAGVAGCGRSRPGAVDWPSWGSTAENTHFASTGQVNTANVARLRVVWRRSEGPGQFAWESFPVVVGRTMYFTTGTDEVVAVDAATGRLRWAYQPRVEFLAGPPVGALEPVNRGVAVGAGTVYAITYDDQLIALDASTGRRLWEARVNDPNRGYIENSPPVYWHGELILGGPAGDAGLRGFVAAFDARTGRRLWRTYTVPAAGHGWNVARPARGGGHVWMPPVVDPRSGTVYAATGNPTPAFNAAQRPGCDPWSDATVALDARTGRLEWGHTEVCGDSWDYDTDQAPALFDVRVNGRAVRAVGDGNKAGFYTTLDARTGALIARTPELVRYSQPHRVPTRAGAVVCPGIFGGLEYGPPAYSPRTRDVYVTGIDMCMRYTLLSEAALRRQAARASGLGGVATPVGGATGVLVSVDPASGHIVWRDPLPRPAVGGALVTAGGLVFAGDDDGSLYAFDARTGRVLWRVDLGLRFGSAPIAYEVGGREFIAVAAGGSALTGDGAMGGGELFAFGLPGRG